MCKTVKSIDRVAGPMLHSALYWRACIITYRAVITPYTVLEARLVDY